LIREVVGPLLRQGGREALGWFRRATVERKADDSEVTDADRASERVIADGLARELPGFGVVSEEGTTISETAGGTWYVDPLDGTNAFLEGLADWGPTACLVRDGVVACGALYLPRLDELWWAVRGGGAWVTHADGFMRLSPHNPETIGRSHSLYLPSRFHRVTVDWPGKVRALGSSAYHLAQVAYGGGRCLDAGALATVIAQWSLWDVGCGVLLVEEAGRSVVDLAGAPFQAVGEPNRPFVAGCASAIDHVLANLPSRPVRR
jgi:myo-inositol-1(or 4)-monophosphatase